MTIAPLTLRQDYWETFEYQEKDLDFLYNHLLEIETPQTAQELVRDLIVERIKSETQSLKSQNQANGKIYIPKDHYEVGQALVFPAMEWQTGKVVSVRSGNNPELPPFEVIGVDFNSSESRQFAASLEQHILNQPVEVKLDDPGLDANSVMKKYGDKLVKALTEDLESNPDLIRIAGRWFPRALLVDVNIGYLNLAEALLDMEGGGPLPTRSILEQIELPTDVNIKLTEFSLNLALQEDGRFDEVGPAGEVVWYLRRLEPEGVQNTPTWLRYSPISYDHEQIAEIAPELENQISDELEDRTTNQNDARVTINVLYPHWRAGTIPLVNSLKSIFPTAMESPRVRFTFVDGDTQANFQGWVVLSNNYVYGLREWYLENNVLPGSILHIERGKKPGEVIIQADKRRPTRDWLRTAIVGADGGIVFATLKQLVATTYDDRMVIAVPDFEAVDAIWQQGRQKSNFEPVVMAMMRELTKLSPQGHVHAQELYAAVNLVRRCPPGPILSLLVDRPWANHLGDLYFRFIENDLQEDGNYA
jgi:hypothetical protein